MIISIENLFYKRKKDEKKKRRKEWEAEKDRLEDKIIKKKAK